jgi:hypothetical protein
MTEVVMMHKGLHRVAAAHIEKKKMRGKNIASGEENLEDSCPSSNVLVYWYAHGKHSHHYRAALVLREGRSKLHTARLILCFKSTI